MQLQWETQVAHNTMEMENEKHDAGKETFRTVYAESFLICGGTR
jgi:hypothetical protein